MVRGLKNKGKMIFAKDKKQVIMLAVVFVLFIISSARAAIMVYMEQHPEMQAKAVPIEELRPNPSGITSENTSETPDPLSGDDPTAELADQGLSKEANNLYSKTVELKKDLAKKSQALIAPNAQIDNSIEILTKKRANTKKVTVAVVDAQRANPFLPAAENIPKDSLPYLTPPPDLDNTDEEMGKLFSTTVSGIMYDKYSPSAIIKIENTDYLVKKGDVINNYKVLAINQNNVYVKLGSNIYRAGVGGLFSRENLSSNTVANLNKKFGGNNNIPIKVKKRT